MIRQKVALRLRKCVDDLMNSSFKEQRTLMSFKIEQCDDTYALLSSIGWALNLCVYVFTYSLIIATKPGGYQLLALVGLCIIGTVLVDFIRIKSFGDSSFTLFLKNEAKTFYLIGHRLPFAIMCLLTSIAEGLSLVVFETSVVIFIVYAVLATIFYKYFSEEKSIKTRQMYIGGILLIVFVNSSYISMISAITYTLTKM